MGWRSGTGLREGQHRCGGQRAREEAGPQMVKAEKEETGGYSHQEGEGDLWRDEMERV